MPSTIAVSLRLAYAWDCPDCGIEVFERGIVVDMASEDAEKIREDYGIQPWTEGDFLLSPDTVKCPHCGREFSTLTEERSNQEEDLW